MKFPVLGATVGICVLSGCVNYVPGQTAAPTSSKPLHAGYLLKGRHCPRVDELSAVPVRLGQDRTVSLGSTSACVALQSGINEPADLLKLPVSRTVYYVTVRTRRAPMMLMPRLEFLDGKRQVLDTLTYKNMKSKGNAMSVAFFVKPGKGQPTYLLVYPDPALIGKKHQRLQQSEALNYYVFYASISGAERKSTITYAEQGTLEIRLVSYQTSDLNRSGQ
ncbi:MAG: hypothetical protein ACRETC_04095 [Gammaproteobacteria bacterium]